MTPERWRLLEEVFQGAVELPPPQRAEYVAHRCGGDAELRAEVESLLEAEGAAADRIQAAISREAELAATEAAARIEGRRIGPYRLVGELGRGGMGGVYLAVRDDEQYHTEVAIKLLPWGLETPEAVARFRDERQILATLQHPGIVRLLDGGSEQGIPYLVMERIEGISITRYAQEHDLSVRARVELFLKVCGAVRYAHQHLVVHRDLKPNNILVTPAGEPKLLDFGIAKLLGEEAGAKLAARTRTGMPLLTPEYASPEQVRGEVASTATDVYSLGVILYELLTGEPAHRLEGTGIAALRTILEVDPPRPSTVASPSRRRALHGDLDKIVLKALEKEPARRYASAEQLAEDLHRHLEGLPVQARAGGWAYRTGKFVRRHVALVSAGALVLLALVVATVVSLTQARRADDQARRAERRFNDVRRLAHSLLFEVDGKIQNLAGATEARRLIVSRALRYLDGLAQEAGRADRTLLQELATAYLKIGDIQGSPLMPNLGRPRDALRSYKKARAILDRLGPAQDEPLRWARAKTLFGIARLLRWEKTRTAEIRPLLLEAMRLVDSVSPAARIDPTVVLLGHTALFSLEARAGAVAAARRHAQKAVEMAREWSRRSGLADARYWVGVARELLGEGFALAADPDAAARELGRAVQVFEGLVAEHSENGKYQRELWRALSYEALYRQAGPNGRPWLPGLGDLRGARRLVSRALRVAERLAARDPQDARAQVELVTSLSHLAQLTMGSDPGSGLRLLKRARALMAGLSSKVRRAGYVKNKRLALDCALAVPLARAGYRREARAAIEKAGALLAGTGANGARSVGAQARRLECEFQLAWARAVLGEDSAAERGLTGVRHRLRDLLRDRTATVRPYIGLIEVLRTLAEVQPAQRCALHERARAVWASRPGAPTAYTRRRAGEIAAALRHCRGTRPRE